MDFPDRPSSIIINNLRSGFAKLNDYCYKLGISDTPYCQCGAKETVEHYLLQCELYEECRQKLQHELYLLTGCMYIDMEVLLTVGKTEDNVTETQRLRLMAEYTENSKRFSNH